MSSELKDPPDAFWQLLAFVVLAPVVVASLAALLNIVWWKALLLWLVLDVAVSK